MPLSSFIHPLFGEVTFRTASPEWKRGDAIFFISGFNINDVTPITIPQLKGIPGSNDGELHFHRLAHQQILAVFKAIEEQGYLHLVKSCAGTLNPRLRKPTSGALSKLPSNHAFGIAIDLNEDDPGFGDSVAPFAPIFQSFGFTWGKSFNDPMHFEVNQFFQTEALKKPTEIKFISIKQHVSNRGVPTNDFLEQLIAWGKSAPDEIFAPNSESDIYSSIKNILGPWRDINHRRAVMLEVMRVLAGFESSWDWNAGRDKNNPTSVTPETIEAGAWQVSANSMHFGQELKDLVLRDVGTFDGNIFQKAMKENHPLAMEYVSRLLRRTIHHHGPVSRHEIDPWLRRDAVREFETMLL
ncbi:MULTISPECIES: M15 family metallopeptidase [Klebsiella]|uniref:M15 family metallopeptidase n=1 Tax=Klebsiella TaxID=570 RepID=UPI000C288805|nr:MULTISPECIES: M15 family metallopeptidase [Klebsiella]PJR66822.1 hypothetical protein CWM61_00835 [Klebsiella sp. K-Nf6]WAL54806.1 M15 family metallopeptidase [Klebsiella variicola subsp. tropica]